MLTRRLRRHDRNARAALSRRRVVALAAGAAIVTVAGVATAFTFTPTVVETPVVVMATGDLGGSVNEIRPVADLINAQNPDRILITGDLVYPDGVPSGYNGFFDTVYGPSKAKIIAAPGNHDYHTAGGAGFYGYFTGQSKCYGQPIGNGWHVVNVNTEESVTAGSACEVAVKNYLNANAGAHFLAITHHPRYTGGSSHGDFSALDAIVADLDAAKADLFVAGHNHLYERFQPMGAGGSLRAEGQGLRFFTAGTGGNGLYSCTSHVGREACIDQYHGALRLNLYADSFDWAFLTTTGLTLDAGTAPTRTGGVPPSSTSSSSSSTTSSSSSSSTSSSTSTTTSTVPGSCTNLPFKYGLDAWPFTFTSGSCAQGGTAWGAWDYASTPWSTFHRTGSYTIKGVPRFTVRDSAAINYGDGFRAEAGTEGWTFDHVYGAYLHDDLIEADWNTGGTVRRSWGEAYVIFSAKAAAGQGGDGSANMVTLADNFFRLAPTPTVYSGPANGTGPFFKLDANSPRLTLENNVWRADQLPNHGTLGITSKVVACSGQVIVWGGTPGGFPATALNTWRAQCPDVVLVEGPVALALWDQLATNFRAGL